MESCRIPQQLLHRKVISSCAWYNRASSTIDRIAFHYVIALSRESNYSTVARERESQK